MKIVKLTILFLLLSFYAEAQNAWNRITPTPQENTIRDICRIPGTEKIIAVGNGATVMITEDLGETWELILNPAGLSNEIPMEVVYFYDDLIGYISSEYWIFETDTYYRYILKTIDGGYSWSVISNLPGTGYWGINDLYFINPDTGIAVGYEGKMIKTIDGGENWSEIGSGVSYNLNSIDFCNDSTGFIVGSYHAEALKTSDYGNNWSLVGFISPMTDGGLYDLKFVSDSVGYIIGHDGCILKTINSGASWDYVFVGSATSIWARTIDFFDENNGVAGCYKYYMLSCLMATHDGGSTWTEFLLPEFHEEHSSVCCLDTNSFLFCGNEGMVYSSTNGGINWNPHFERSFWGSIYQVQYLNNDLIYCLACDNRYIPFATSRLYKSIDGGENYTSVINCNMYDLSFKTPVAFHFLDENMGYFTYWNDSLNVEKTTDGGDSWTKVESGNFTDKPYAIQFHDEQNGLISGFISIFKTIDGGNTWVQVHSSYMFPFIEFMDIQYLNSNEVIVAGGELGYTVLVKSQDGGNTWEEMVLGQYGLVYDIGFFNNVLFLLCENSTILKSTDGGNSWQFTTINSPDNIEMHNIHFLNENTGYAVGSGPFATILKSTDGGDTWNAIQAGATSGLNAVHFLDENTGYVYGENGLILKTTTGGMTSIHKPRFNKLQNSVSVYPNPFSETIKVKYQLVNSEKKSCIEVFGLNGKKILYYGLRNPEGEAIIDCKGFKTGVYLIVLRNEQEIMEIRKVIKK